MIFVACLAISFSCLFMLAVMAAVNLSNKRNPFG
jgi:hypothetical protein